MTLDALIACVCILHQAKTERKKKKSKKEREVSSFRRCETNERAFNHRVRRRERELEREKRRSQSGEKALSRRTF